MRQAKRRKIAGYPTKDEPEPCGFFNLTDGQTKEQLDQLNRTPQDVLRDQVDQQLTSLGWGIQTFGTLYLVHNANGDPALDEPVSLAETTLCLRDALERKARGEDIDNRGLYLVIRGPRH